MPAADTPAPGSPAPLAALRPELMRAPPFAQMTPAQVDRWIVASRQTHHPAGETLLQPSDGPVTALRWVRRGAVAGRHGLADAAGGFQLEAGDLFPVGALLGERAVTATYQAVEDTCCLETPAAVVRALAAESTPLADHLHRRVQQVLALSQRALQASYASQALAQQSLETPLASLPRKTPLAVAPGTPLRIALAFMHERRVGSVLVADAQGRPLGILTRHDLLGRVTLPGVDLSRPIDDVMSRPVHAVAETETALDAALAMSREGIRHLPITDADGRLASIVSERDLFALQRLSLTHLGTSLRAAADLPTLVDLAGRIRRFAAALLGQGVHARQLTALVSHLNDTLTARWVTLVAARRGLDLGRACWLAFGSEGRQEQTVSTDQDNGLVFASDDPARDRPAWLAFAREVNDGLAACGYPLCSGDVMASNPECCLTPAEWSDRIGRWIRHGAPQDLLHASIHFDLRPLAGAAVLAAPLRERITREAAATPRFIKQMADNARRTVVPLNWRGAVEPQRVDGRAVLDLKRQGTALFVDLARLYALALGVEATGTRDRFEAVGVRLGVPPAEREAWSCAFEFLQMLRLRVQLPADGSPPPAHPNRIALGDLNDIDRRMLRESLRVARRLQQRLALDYDR